MKNIKSIRAAIMLALLSSVFIFAACAKEEGRKITDKDIADTTWTLFPGESQIKFNKDKTFNTIGYESLKASWKITKIKIEDYVAARIGLGNPEDIMNNTKTGKNTTVYAIMVKGKNFEINEEVVMYLIVADKYFTGSTWLSDKNFCF